MSAELDSRFSVEELTEFASAVLERLPNMAPFGGKERFLGTNPLAIGIPGKERVSFRGE